MRIRSIRPEFWTSEDVAAMDWNTRLVYIGLWSYVDDNGVGRDIEPLIVASLFPLDESLSESSLRVHRALKHLAAGGNITRYKVGSKPYLHIAAWTTHQKINRPTGSRYPLPTSANAVAHDILSEPSVSPHANAVPGEGEKGRRGEGTTTSDAARSDDPDGFAGFWAAYPRKDAKRKAAQAFKAALKRADAQTIIAGAKAYASVPREPRFVAMPTTWLNGDRWADEGATVVKAAPAGGGWDKGLPKDPYGLEEE